MVTPKKALLVAWLLVAGTVSAAAEVAGGAGADWMSWQAADDVSNTASLQRGARNFMGYCLGCHSLKYERYSRLASDLSISPEELQQYLLPPGAKPAD